MHVFYNISFSIRMFNDILRLILDNVRFFGNKKIFLEYGKFEILGGKWPMKCFLDEEK